MNRVIKFRGWDGKKFHYFGLEEIFFQGSRNQENGGNEWSPSNLEIQEFTNLKDKNGKEIYEGDLYKDEHGMRVIEYSERMACFISTLARDRELGNPIYFENRAEIEVIGNIYENPELLK